MAPEETGQEAKSGGARRIPNFHLMPSGPAQPAPCSLREVAMDSVDSLLTAVREALAREPRLDLR
ncbi:hypothetical protein [Archangium violaceum]|uniref:Uncharacterized protein n=1 Tax=Archangium violaceum Cb vi76 TaxID=1406225 RepID=A0A084SSS6_9BACT|nr:hypothetical protein [Archangium violaceum]KFA91511.1 hypothetical protein Q664_21335 [Archangium violaceum Cb vi76]